MCSYAIVLQFRFFPGDLRKRFSYSAQVRRSQPVLFWPFFQVGTGWGQPPKKPKGLLALKACNPLILLWCRDPELNWGHGDFQSPALPTELSRRGTSPYNFPQSSGQDQNAAMTIYRRVPPGQVQYPGHRG